ncbi:MAG TPA: hypothetical protein VMI06_15160 [Terriglobia bacterium]|nr:hypothetical protein [Terriglobia bacterium]
MAKPVAGIFANQQASSIEFDLLDDLDNLDTVGPTRASKPQLRTVEERPGFSEQGEPTWQSRIVMSS